MKELIQNYLKRYYKDYKDYPKHFRDYIFGYSNISFVDIITYHMKGYDGILSLDYGDIIADLYLYYLRAENKVGSRSIHYLDKVLKTRSISLLQQKTKSINRMKKITADDEEQISNQIYKDIRHKEAEQIERENKMQEIQCKLTKSEVTILQYMLDGKCYYEICQMLDITPNTFKTLRCNIKRKLDQSNQDNVIDNNNRAGR